MVRRGIHSPEQARQTDVIEPGLYRLSLVRQGWKVPCRIVQALDWFGEVDEKQSPHVIDPFDCPVIVRIHEWGEKISDRHYGYLIGIKVWARQHDPSHPCLDPWKSMDPMQLRPLIPRGTWKP